EFRIQIKKVECEPATAINKFSVPDAFSNVILRIGEQRLHVSKEFLSIHSPVFASMFFGEYVEKHKQEIEIKEVEYEEFVDLLNAIYPDGRDIGVSNVQHIL
ncbi:hypothetical protein PFISCL1PPCAC_20999, partial [Pristionchus fissidentatus]